MLTTLIPCKNELRHIEECVESARQLGGEILVADSGSTDGTLDLVAAMPDCRLIQREFVNYSDFKNWAIPQAGYPWVLVLDADERVTPELADEIRAAVAADRESVDAYRISRRSFFLGHEVRFGPWLHDGVHRLFRRDRCRYNDCLVHESLVFAKEREGRLRHPLLHHTAESYDSYFAKHLRYTHWGAQQRWRQGRRSSSLAMLVKPMFRFFWLYLARGGFLDGALGVQTCMLQAFFVTFVKQARLWEMEHGRSPERGQSILPLRRPDTPRRAA